MKWSSHHHDAFLRRKLPQHDLVGMTMTGEYRKTICVQTHSNGCTTDVSPQVQTCTRVSESPTYKVYRHIWLRTTRLRCEELFTNRFFPRRRKMMTCTVKGNWFFTLTRDHTVKFRHCNTPVPICSSGGGEGTRKEKTKTVKHGYFGRRVRHPRGTLGRCCLGWVQPKCFFARRTVVLLTKR